MDIPNTCGITFSCVMDVYNYYTRMEFLVVNWDKILMMNGLKSIIPTKEYFSGDDTEAWISIDFWFRQGVIVRMEEHELITNMGLYYDFF